MAPLVWFITGCSSGLGHALTKYIIARGDHAIATARSLPKIADLEQAGASVLQLDVTSSQSSINATISAAISIHGHIDVLVNNAGFIQIGTVEELEHEDWVRQFDTNVFGAIKVTKGMLPHFRERKRGTTVFVGSLSGWVGHEACGAYAGSKFAMEGIAESLHRETAHLGLRTLLIEPGRFRTNFLSPAHLRTTPQSSIPEYADMLGEKMQGLAAEDGAQPGDPDKLVEIVVDLVKGEGVAKGKDVPVRMPLGTDCADEVREKCRGMGRILDEWDTVTRSTDF